LSEHSAEVLETVGIRTGSVIADFGCGSGAYAIPAAKLTGSSGRVYALDQDQKALEKLQARALAEGLEQIETVLSSGLNIDLGSESVDLLLFHDVLHMIDQRATLFGSAYRILKPEGRVSIYPMHIDNDEVSRQMQASGFALADEAYEGNILVFTKTDRVHE
jgi:ubiquinone/menaquinone biosynthesis C-methylase UbiE